MLTILVAHLNMANEELFYETNNYLPPSPDYEDGMIERYGFIYS